MAGIKKLGCLGVLSRKTIKNPKRMNLTRRVSGRTHVYFCANKKKDYSPLFLFEKTSSFSYLSSLFFTVPLPTR